MRRTVIWLACLLPLVAFAQPADAATKKEPLLDTDTT
jgi:hypothetical protein